MAGRTKASLRSSSPYNAAVTREQFLFYEMRAAARLVSEGRSHAEIFELIVKDNLFQYPTEKSVRKIVSACLRRLDALEDAFLVQAIAEQPGDAAKQICLYAMMKQYRLVWDFMITVVGDKYRSRDDSFGKSDIDAYIKRLREQDDWVAVWSDSTLTKVRQVLAKILVENGYLDSLTAGRLNPVLICSVLENSIRGRGDNLALPAFNCFL